MTLLVLNNWALDFVVQHSTFSLYETGYTPQPRYNTVGGSQTTDRVSLTNRVKSNVQKTDSERRVNETVFAKVCLPLIHAIIFRIMLVSFTYFFTKEKSAHSH